MLKKSEEWVLLEEKELTTDYKGITIEIPDNCKVLDLRYYDIGGLRETKMLHNIKFYKIELESDEDYELRKQKLKEKYYQEYLDKIKELEND